MGVYRRTYWHPRRRSQTALLAQSAPAQILVDDSVARFTGTPGNGSPITSGSFTPPNDSLLVVAVNGDTSGGPDDITISVSGGSLAWTNEVERDPGDGGGANDGHASLWTAEVATGASMQVSVTRTAGNGGTNRLSAKVYIVTGYNVGDPVGAVGEGSSATTSNTPNAYTSTVDSSRGFGCATDWGQNGNLTSSDVEDVADYAGAIAVISLYKAANTPTSGSTVTINFDTDGGGTSAWNWVAIEVKPGVASGDISSNVTTTAATSRTEDEDVTTTSAVTRTEDEDVATTAAVSQTGTSDVTTSVALSTTNIANVTTDAATTRVEDEQVTTTAAISRTEDESVTTTAATSRTEDEDVATDASVTVAGQTNAEVATTAATARVEDEDVSTTAALSQSVQSDVSATGALSRTEDEEVSTSAAVTRAEDEDVSTSAATSRAEDESVTSDAALSRAEDEDVSTTAATARVEQSSVTTDAAISIQGQVLMDVETSAAIGPPATLLIDDRTLSASWVDDRTISASWIDSRTIRSSWVDNRIL
jgi:hypothetical protein